ncbi:MAG: DUF4914 family protein [Candidatus Hydrogenedentota bacterium]
MATDFDIKRFRLPAAVNDILSSCPAFTVAHNVSELVELAVGKAEGGWQEVTYDVPGQGMVTEARACRLRNGVAVNYEDPYMRRRDPACMYIADRDPTDKPRYHEEFGADFGVLRAETFDWLKQQELAVFAFVAGAEKQGLKAMVIAPANAGFFALGLALLQGILDPDALPEDFSPQAVIYVAPPFRHTHFGGRQVVVHNRLLGLHEVFSYNLYPGPSAKKGVYGMLINLGEREQWVTAHCSTTQVVTPYDNKLVIMHEGASGGGKSEMLETVHRERDGRLKLGQCVVTGEERYLTLPRACGLHPITDDMALCHPHAPNANGKLVLSDAENAWFIRVNHIQHYGIDPLLEEITIHPGQPLLFLNIDAAPGGTGLIWEHIEDAPGVPCPNPRVVLPRDAFPGVINEPVRVDVRSFGVRTPPCTSEHPTYGILGLMHVLPPALAWLWRLVAPRGHGNPSITDSQGMQSEGVGSYWPFATGRRVDQANLLLKQIVDTPRMRYILVPNQHIGAWETGFMPQWIAREYLARRGGAWFSEDQLKPSRCSLLGYAVRQITVEGQMIGNWFLRVETQPEVGEAAYDAGAAQLQAFFKQQLEAFRDPDLFPMGERIIDCFMSNGAVEDYAALIQREDFFGE